MPLFKRESVSWGILVVEMVAIMVSVVLGFMLNEWRESRTRQVSVDRAMVIMAAELETNLELTRARREVHAAFDDTLAALAQVRGEDAPLEPTEVGVTNLPPYVFLSGAYETARLSGALAAMDFDHIEVVTRAYSVQEMAMEASWLLNDWFHQGRFETIQDYRLALVDLLNPELPAIQELALRVLQGERRSEVEEAVSERYWPDGGG
jgi:hypothetical protein